MRTCCWGPGMRPGKVLPLCFPFFPACTCADRSVSFASPTFPPRQARLRSYAAATVAHLHVRASSRRRRPPVSGHGRPTHASTCAPRVRVRLGVLHRRFHAHLRTCVARPVDPEPRRSTTRRPNTSMSSARHDPKRKETRNCRGMRSQNWTSADEDIRGDPRPTAVI